MTHVSIALESKAWSGKCLACRDNGESHLAGEKVDRAFSD
jgi:hypothetical protein